MAKIVFDDGKSVELSVDTVKRLEKELGVPTFERYVDGCLEIDVDTVVGRITIETDKVSKFSRTPNAARLLANVLNAAADFIERK